jgi:hypothetical protein
MIIRDSDCVGGGCGNGGIVKSFTYLIDLQVATNLLGHLVHHWRERKVRRFLAFHSDFLCSRVIHGLRAMTTIWQTFRVICLISRNCNVTRSRGQDVSANAHCLWFYRPMINLEL